MYTADELEQASRIVYAAMPPTPQFAWPLLAKATGCETWVKHENHTPTAVSYTHLTLPTICSV